MPLFDIIKYPERVEHDVPVCTQEEEESTLAPMQISELEVLRAAARDADAHAAAANAPEFPMDSLAERFLSLCLIEAHESSVQPYKFNHDTEEGFDTRRALRFVAVPLLTGDWPTVLGGRESASATVAALRCRGYGSPLYEYRRVADAWGLWIRFSF